MLTLVNFRHISIVKVLRNFSAASKLNSVAYIFGFNNNIWRLPYFLLNLLYKAQNLQILSSILNIFILLMRFRLTSGRKESTFFCLWISVLLNFMRTSYDGLRFSSTFYQLTLTLSDLCPWHLSDQAFRLSSSLFSKSFSIY